MSFEGWQPGDLGWTRSTGFVGGAIRFGEIVRFCGWVAGLRHLAARILGVAQRPQIGDPGWGNHIFVYVGDGRIIEALGGGLTANRIDKYRPQDVIRLSMPGHYDCTDAVSWAQAELKRREPYSWLSIASIIAQVLTPERIDVNWADAMTCVAFGLRCWEHAGIDVARNPYTAMPTDAAVLAGVVHLPVAA